MRTEPVVLQRKITGVLMRAAREKAHRTVNEVSQRLNVTPARIRACERGNRDVFLPELEVLAQFLQKPISFFFDVDANVVESTPDPVRPEEMRTRRSMIGAKLKQARLAEGKSKEECAQVIGRKSTTLGRYERGLTNIPIVELEMLAQFLRVNLYYFVERRSNEAETDGMDLDRLAKLPRDVRMFALDAGNLPYLRMAMKFADMPTNRLKELGEILLVVR